MVSGWLKHSLSDNFEIYGREGRVQMNQGIMLKNGVTGRRASMTSSGVMVVCIGLLAQLESQDVVLVELQSPR